MNGEASVTQRKTRGRNAALVLGIGLLASLMTYASISADSAPKVAPAKSAGVAASSRGVGSGVPLQINHQGVVQSGGVRFNGTGLFRFAIVDPDTGDQVWTNDGTNVPGPGTPTAAVSVMGIVNGVYSVALGDAAITNMTTISSTLFSDDNLVLRIWFDDGPASPAVVEQLTPDHALGTSPYAFRAAIASAAEGLNRPGTSTAAVTVDASGNVGIGTTNPGGKLTIDASSAGSNSLSITGVIPGRNILQTTAATTGNNLAVMDHISTGEGRLVLYFNNEAKIQLGTNRDTYFTGGSVGFGTSSPSARLTIQGSDQDANGSLRIQSNSGKGWNIFPQDTTPSSMLRFNNGSAEGALSDAGIWIDGSDRAYKKDIAQIAYGLEELMKLQPRQYRMKATDKKQIGFVAQEIERILPELVSGEEGAKGMSYGQLTAVITRAVQQQQVQIDQLKAERNALIEATKEQNAEIVSMKKRVERLEAQVNRTRVSR